MLWRPVTRRWVSVRQQVIGWRAGALIEYFAHQTNVSWILNGWARFLEFHLVSKLFRPKGLNKNELIFIDGILLTKWLDHRQINFSSIIYMYLILFCNNIENIKWSRWNTCYKILYLSQAVIMSESLRYEISYMISIICSIFNFFCT